MNDSALIMFHDFTVTSWCKVFNLTYLEIVMYFNFLSRHYLIVIVVCIFKEEEYLP